MVNVPTLLRGSATYMSMTQRYNLFTPGTLFQWVWFSCMLIICSVTDIFSIPTITEPPLVECQDLVSWFRRFCWFCTKAKFEGYSNDITKENCTLNHLNKWINEWMIELNWCFKLFEWMSKGMNEWNWYFKLFLDGPTKVHFCLLPFQQRYCRLCWVILLVLYLSKKPGISQLPSQI